MYNNRVKIKELINGVENRENIVVMGWVRTFRNNQFISPE